MLRHEMGIGHDFASPRIWLTDIIDMVNQKTMWAGAQHLQKECMRSQSAFFSYIIPRQALNTFRGVIHLVSYMFLSLPCVSFTGIHFLILLEM